MIAHTLGGGGEAPLEGRVLNSLGFQPQAESRGRHSTWGLKPQAGEYPPLQGGQRGRGTRRPHLPSNRTGGDLMALNPHSPRGAVRSEINVTPLVDVCLVLLIIFMVMTPLIQAGVKVDLPKTAKSHSMPGQDEQLTVTV